MAASANSVLGNGLSRSAATKIRGTILFDQPDCRFLKIRVSFLVLPNIIGYELMSSMVLKALLM
ncbi:hypothetical protein V8352_17965 [Roseovarius sp. D0-M9]